MNCRKTYCNCNIKYLKLFNQLTAKTNNENGIWREHTATSCCHASSQKQEQNTFSETKEWIVSQTNRSLKYIENQSFASKHIYIWSLSHCTFLHYSINRTKEGIIKKKSVSLRSELWVKTWKHFSLYLFISL